MNRRLRRSRLQPRGRAGWWLSVLGGIVLAGCRASVPTEVEVEVRSVSVDHASGSPVVLLQDKAKRVALPIWIGPAEAQSIAMQLEGVRPPRPLTHDLMKLALEQAGVEFDKVVIHDLKDSTYYARIVLHSGRKTLDLDSRPSDAIALAVRFRKPIFVATALLHPDVTIDLRHEASGGGVLTIAGLTLQDLTDELAGSFDMPGEHGVLISNVARDVSVALQRGDIILKADGERVSDVAALQTKLTLLPSGAHLDLAIRRGSTHLHVDFTPG